MDRVPAWDRLGEQLSWYDRSAAHNQRWYLRLKVLQIVVAAAIPVLAAADVEVVVAGVLGAIIVVLEGLQQLFQYQQHWAAYRSTCEALKHERHLFLAEAGPYAGVARPEALLAERVEGLASQEHAAWVTEQHEARSRAGAGAGAGAGTGTGAVAT